MKLTDKIKLISQKLSNPIHLISEALNMNPAGVYKIDILSERESKLIDKALEAYIRRIPLARTFHRACFYHLILTLFPTTFQPRRETEALVEYVTKNLQPTRILDVCTGSGAILLSILDLFPNATGVGTDISNFCTENARLNAANLNVSHRATFIQTDFTNNLEAEFDLLIANPPYVSIAVDESAKYDPPIALYENKAYEKIIIGHKLKPGGIIILEVPSYKNLFVLLREANFEIIENRAIGEGIMMLVAKFKPQ